MDRLSTPFRLALIGKFSHGSPTTEETRQIFAKLDLKGNDFPGHLDQKHVLIKLEHEGDFHSLCLKELMHIDGFSMRIFRWSLDFQSDFESLVVSIWIGFPNLPIFILIRPICFP